MNDTSPFPAPSLRELARPKGVTEGVSSDGCFGPMVYTQFFNSEFLTVYVHRSTLPQSRIRSTAPSEREPGTAVPFIQPPRNRNVAGDFHRPYESSEVGRFYHSTKYTPSVSFADSSLREGAGKRPHSTGCSLNRGVGGRFSSPLRNCEFSTPYEYGVHPTQRGGWNGV